jgi:hypothetical protein
VVPSLEAWNVTYFILETEKGREETDEERCEEDQIN